MDNSQITLMSDYLDNLLEVNKKINLTRITDIDEAKILHIEDSLSALEELNNAPEGLYGDIGSGGGFPGVPLAIATGRKTILIDSVQKKMKAVSEILNSIGLDQQISTLGERIEDVGISMRGEFSVLTARALSKLSILMELASPLLKDKGQLICLKANLTDEELEHAQSLEDQLGMKLINRRSFYLSDKTTYREILVFEKNKKPSIKLPRKVGMAQKKPL